MTDAKSLGFVPPPHPNAKPHKTVMEMLSNMTPEQFRQWSINAGFHTDDGQLTAQYLPEDLPDIKPDQDAS